MLPLVLAQHSGPSPLTRLADLLADRPQSEHRWLAEHAPGWTIAPASIRIDVYDLGMAVMNATLDVTTQTSEPADTFASNLKQLVWLKATDHARRSPLTEALCALAGETCASFALLVRDAVPHAIVRPWLTPFLDATATDHATPDWGRVLWLHPVHLHALTPEETVDQVSADLLPPFAATVPLPNGRFLPGIGWSALITDGRTSTVDDPVHLIETHWAYIALYMEIDRGLLALLDRQHHRTNATLRELEDAADECFSAYARVMEARARVDSALAALGGDEQNLWDILSGISRFDALVDGVDRKVDTLQRITERRAQQATGERSRRTTAILSFLTALTLVTVSIALLGSVIGNRSDPLGHLEVRLVVISVALLAAIVLYREAFRERRHSRRDD